FAPCKCLAPGAKIEIGITLRATLERILVPVVVTRRWKAERLELPHACALDKRRPVDDESLAGPGIGADPVGAGRAISEIEEEPPASRQRHFGAAMNDIGSVDQQ